MPDKNQTTRKTCVCSRIILCLIVVLAILCCVCGYKLYKHENRQNQEIKFLSNTVLNLQSEIEKINSKKFFWSDNGYNYLAIGNSITSHPLSDYWWNENIGMAASSEDKDYVHLIGKWLKDNKKEEVIYQAYNFVIWEMQDKDRAETLSLLEFYLNEKLDLITIQLSENVIDITTLETDCIELFRYIHNKAPNAQIIVLDDFWDKGDKSAIKEKATKTCEIDFVSLNDIKDNLDFQARKGSVVYDKNGVAHVIEHDGVAVHPGDKGMAYIAEEVVKIIK